MFEFLLNNKQVHEIQSLVKNLKSSDNSSYLNFEISQTSIIVNDNIFNVKFDIDQNSQNKNIL